MELRHAAFRPMRGLVRRARAALSQFERAARPARPGPARRSGACYPATCPVCRRHGMCDEVLCVPSLVRGQGTLSFLHCPSCACKFVRDYQPVTYESAEFGGVPLHFYLEQGAGIGSLARPAFAAAAMGAASYLDVGCGFGFGVDFATLELGLAARGIDPGPLARVGTRMLGLDIIAAELGEAELADGRFDVINSCEVIEHVTDPAGFVHVLRAHLAPGGVLMLSTPNAAYLDLDPPGDVLQPILSPGYHPILFSEAGLAGLLRASGFRHVQSSGNATTVWARASDRALPPQAEFDATRFLAYLRKRFQAAAPDGPLWTGMGYRLIRHLTDRGAYAEAHAVDQAMRAGLRTQYATPLDDPAVVEDFAAGKTMALHAMLGVLPFCLPGLMFCRSFIATHHLEDAALGRAHMRAAHACAQMMLRSLQAEGLGDGDIADLLRVSAAALAAA